MSIPNGYRIVTSIYSYNPVKKRTKNTETASVSGPGENAANSVESSGDPTGLSYSMNGTSCLMAAKNVELKSISEVRNKFDDFWGASSIIPGTAVNGHSAEVKLKHRGQEFSVWVHVFRSEEKSYTENRAS